MKTPIIIVGGGLSGLYAARLLAASGVDFLLLEARERLGGRILSVTGDGFDLGPAWFWPDMQPMMSRLVRELGLTAFAQHAEGDVLIERFSLEPVQRFAAYGQMASSFRIAGGTAAMVAALAAGLPQHRLRLGVEVTGAELRDEDVMLTARDAEGEAIFFSAAQVIFALPPRLLESRLAFKPPVAQDIRDHWQATPTWMAPHAKFLAVYDRPFWRESGLSGTAQSMVGPLSEIHDASTATGAAALFGFVGVRALARQTIGEDALKLLCIQHLSKLFGPDAAHPVSSVLKDWSADMLTATVDDWDASAGHPSAMQLPWVDAVWSRRAVLAGSETGDTNPGYLEGALEAAAKAVRALGVNADG